MNNPEKYKLLKRIAPWFAGGSLAIAHITVSTNCTVTREGRCSACGSCAVVLFALVTWAVLKKPDVDTDANCKKRV